MKKQQILDRQTVLTTVKPSPIWLGDFSMFVYEKIETNLEYCLHNLHTCWLLPKGRLKFIELADGLLKKEITLEPAKRAKIEKLLEGFHDDIIRVSAFRYKDIKTVRKNEYLDNELSDDSYIAEDHNHRFTSYAIQYLNDAKIGQIPVELYLGKVLD